jgi:hypothetical protein
VKLLRGATERAEACDRDDIIELLSSHAAVLPGRRVRNKFRLSIDLVGKGYHAFNNAYLTDELAIRSELPTRDGLFRAVGYAPTESAPPTVALIHGDLTALRRPLVHVHMACLFGDAFGSLLCDCRRRLDGAVAAMVREGAGVIIYAKPEPPATFGCARDEPIDAALAAGLLRTAGVQRLRLSAQWGSLADQLRARGLELE